MREQLGPAHRANREPPEVDASSKGVFVAASRTRDVRIWIIAVRPRRGELRLWLQRPIAADATTFPRVDVPRVDVQRVAHEDSKTSVRASRPRLQPRELLHSRSLRRGPVQVDRSTSTADRLGRECPSDMAGETAGRSKSRSNRQCLASPSDPLLAGIRACTSRNAMLGRCQNGMHAHAEPHTKMRLRRPVVGASP